MKRSLLANLMLVLVVLCLWWLLEDQQTQEFRLSQVLDAPVESISIQRPDQADIRLQRSASQWHLTDPINAIASHNRTELLLNLLEQPLDARIKESHNMARFGFDGSHVRIQYDHLQIDIGDQEPLSGERYLLYDQQVYLTDDRIMLLLSAGTGSFIDHQPLPATKSVVAMTLPQRQQKQLLPLQQRLTITTDPTIIDSWQQATAIRIQLNPTGLIPVGSPMSVTFSDGSVERFQLQLDGQLIMTTLDGRIAYILPAAMLDTLIPTTE